MSPLWTFEVKIDGKSGSFPLFGQNLDCLTLSFGNGEEDSRAGAWCAFKPDPSAILFDELLAQDKPETCAFFIRRSAGTVAGCFLEENFLDFGLNANAIVDY